MKGGGFQFSQVPQANIPRSSFNRSHGYKTTFDAGKLIPFFVDEALPGDTFSLSASVFSRLATPLVPLMDNIKLDVFFFAIPNRLVWDNWQKFMGEQASPGDSTDYLVPVIPAPAGGFLADTLFDYFGVPLGIDNLEVSALYARAYGLVYNEWFRDQNLQNALLINKGDGPDSAGTIPIMRRGKRHDYFTSCLPWPQKGPGVNLPLGTSAPIIADTAPNNIAQFYAATSGSTAGEGPLQQVTGAGQTVFHVDGAQPLPGNEALAWGTETGLLADLTNATAATINSLRQAFQIQKLLERDARGGTRYIEILRSHFGVVSPDARLQRPEFLGGGSIPVIINPVAQTSASDTQPTPQGNLSAYGVAGGSHLGFTKSFTEHSIILGLICARADLSYQQGLPRMFSRRTRYDFYWPAFAHLGEQAVLNKEIYAQGTAEDEEVFGYQERWAEYRYFPSKITGKFRSTDPQSLDVWHLGQDFAALPTLGTTFIQENPPIERVLAVQNEPQFLFDSHIKMRCTRPMPTYSVPGLIDHF